MFASGRRALLLTITAACCAARAAQSPSRDLYVVTGHVMQVRAYCGGPTPPPEVITALVAPVPLPGKTLSIKNGDVNSEGRTVIATAVTDSTGTFTLKLAPGDYCFLEEYKTRPLTVPANGRWDIDCLRKEWTRCEYALHVRGHDEEITITDHEHCSWNRPCLQSDGATPPAPAAPPVP